MGPVGTGDWGLGLGLDNNEMGGHRKLFGQNNLSLVSGLIYHVFLSLIADHDCGTLLYSYSGLDFICKRPLLLVSASKCRPSLLKTMFLQHEVQILRRSVLDKSKTNLKMNSIQKSDENGIEIKLFRE